MTKKQLIDVEGSYSAVKMFIAICMGWEGDIHYHMWVDVTKDYFINTIVPQLSDDNLGFRVGGGILYFGDTENET